MWQVSILTGAEGEESVAQLLQRTFLQPPSVFRDEQTGAISVTSYPRRLPGSRRAVRKTLQEGVRRLGQFGLDPRPGRIKIRLLPRRDWAQSWKRHFQPIDIRGRLLIKPSWSRRRAKPGQRVVILDPGLSFGTGHHPTTLFCLEQTACCRRPGRPQSFLDIGTGSGILAIAAAKLGYAPVVAFDCDPEALRSSRRNVRRNRVRLRLGRADLARLPRWARKHYDVVCANLTGDLLLAHAPNIRALLKPGGKLVVAGLLGAEFPGIKKKFLEIDLTFERRGLNKVWKSGRFALSTVGSAMQRGRAAKE